MSTKIHAGEQRWLGPATIAAAMVGVALVGNRPLIDALAIGGIGVIVPLALGGSTRWSAVAVGLANGAGFVLLGLLATRSEPVTRTEEQTLLEVIA